MKPATQNLVGLNILRAVAILMMVMAHGVRTQSNFAHLMRQRDQATWLDHSLLWIIDIEPIVSALFLFIAGFSLVLSFQRHTHQVGPWLTRMLKRCAQLYAIAVSFFLAEQGFQWPDFLVSPGILSIIALSLAMTACILVAPQALLGMAVASLAIPALTALLEINHLAITGLNAGAGGILPLLGLGPLGALVGMVYCRWQDNGLVLAFGAALVIAVFALSADTPWIYHYDSMFVFFPGSIWQQWVGTAQALIGPVDPTGITRTARYWNHAAIFAFRTLALLILLTLLFIKLIPQANTRLLRIANYLGSHALSLYILHLVMLAGVEVSGIKPQTGWQTWVLIGIVLGISAGLIRLAQHGWPRLRQAVSGLDPDTAG